MNNVTLLKQKRQRIRSAIRAAELQRESLARIADDLCVQLERVNAEILVADTIHKIAREPIRMEMV
jgi:hypothetical protein